VHNPTEVKCNLCGQVFASRNRMYLHKSRMCPMRSKEGADAAAEQQQLQVQTRQQTPRQAAAAAAATAQAVQMPSFVQQMTQNPYSVPFYHPLAQLAAPPPVMPPQAAHQQSPQHPQPGSSKMFYAPPKH
jgi:hypothetical protein